MISRRGFLASSLALALHGLKKLRGASHHAVLQQPPHPFPEGVARFVKIAIGTGGHGHTYPGATVPFGMVQLSPDTNNQGWDWCSGYHYSDNSIMGFSHTHLSGTGIGDMLDVLLMPCTGTVKTIPGSRENPDAGYRSRFSHGDEVAVPGYYSVLLRDYRIRAELSATARRRHSPIYLPGERQWSLYSRSGSRLRHRSRQRSLGERKICRQRYDHWRTQHSTMGQRT